MNFGLVPIKKNQNCICKLNSCIAFSRWFREVFQYWSLKADCILLLCYQYFRGRVNPKYVNTGTKNHLLAFWFTYVQVYFLKEFLRNLILMVYSKAISLANENTWKKKKSFGKQYQQKQKSYLQINLAILGKVQLIWQRSQSIYFSSYIFVTQLKVISWPLSLDVMSEPNRNQKYSQL